MEKKEPEMSDEENLKEIQNCKKLAVQISETVKRFYESEKVETRTLIGGLVFAISSLCVSQGVEIKTCTDMIEYVYQEMKNQIIQEHLEHLKKSQS